MRIMGRWGEAVLATVVHGGRRALCVDSMPSHSMPSQGLHIIPPNAVLGAAPRNMVEEFSTALEPMDTSTSYWV